MDGVLMDGWYEGGGSGWIREDGKFRAGLRGLFIEMSCHVMSY